MPPNPIRPVPRRRRVAGSGTDGVSENRLVTLETAAVPEFPFTAMSLATLMGPKVGLKVTVSLATIPPLSCKKRFPTLVVSETVTTPPGLWPKPAMEALISVIGAPPGWT